MPTPETRTTARDGRELRAGDPICSNCGYLLRDLVNAACCPECGRPLVEVLTRHSGGKSQVRSIRKRSAATLWGLPIVDIAFGPRPEFGEAYGKARGIIAIGDTARGGIAIGGMAVGVVAFGGLAVGVCSVGGWAIGLAAAMGGGAIGGIAIGGGAAGGIAVGGGAAGVVAQGGGALGVYARGPGAHGKYVVSPRRTDQEAVEMFKTLSPLMGARTPARDRDILPMVALCGGAIGMCTLAVAVVAIVGHQRWHSRQIAPQRRFP